MTISNNQKPTIYRNLYDLYLRQRKASESCIRPRSSLFTSGYIILKSSVELIEEVKKYASILKLPIESVSYYIMNLDKLVYNNILYTSYFKGRFNDFIYSALDKNV